MTAIDFTNFAKYYKPQPLPASASIDDIILSRKNPVVLANKDDGRLFSPAKFKPNTKRKIENVIYISELVFDFDKLTDDITKEDIIASIPFRCHIHTTYRHLDPEEGGTPRYRMGVFLEPPIPRDNYKPTAFAFLDKYVKHKVDTACLEPSRMFYYPAVPQDRLEYYEHMEKQGPLFDFRTLEIPKVVAPKKKTADIFYISPALKEAFKIVQSNIPDFPEEKITENRNCALTRFLGHLTRKGLTEAEWLEKARTFNLECCIPPMDDAEVSRTVSGCYGRYNKPVKPVVKPKIFFDELMLSIKDLAPDADDVDEKAEEVMKASLSLKAVKQKQILRALSKQLDMPQGELKLIAKSFRRDSGDDLSLCDHVIDSWGEQNIIGCPVGIHAYAENLGYWQELDARAFKQKVQNCLGQMHDVSVDSKRVSGVCELIKNKIHDASHVWDVLPLTSVALANGILSFKDGKKKLEAHRRENYITSTLPFAYDEKATAPIYAKYKATTFAGDIDIKEKSQSLDELIFYTLLRHCQHEKAVFLIGQGSNGKSVLLKLLEAMVGKMNCVAIQPTKFDNVFQRARLRGKLLNLITELAKNQLIPDGSFKNIASGEPSEVEEKRKTPFTLRSFATLWAASNSMPRSKDFSLGLMRRIIIITFNNLFKDGVADSKLSDNLAREVSGIFNVCLDAYLKVQERGYITEPPCSIHAKNAWLLQADQCSQFIKERCTTVQGEDDEPLVVGVTELFEDYETWARKVGIVRRLGQQGFSERIQAIGYKKDKLDDVRSFFGLKLK